VFIFRFDPSCHAFVSGGANNNASKMQFLSPFPLSGVFSSPEARPEILASLGNRPWKSIIIVTFKASN
jgi:hypothetical protein